MIPNDFLFFLNCLIPFLDLLFSLNYLILARIFRIKMKNNFNKKTPYLLL